MKMRLHKRSILLVFALLLIGVSLACFVWVRNEQRQYALNRQLIAALMREDRKQAITLVEAGADSNTRLEPTLVPSVPEIVRQLLHHSALQTKNNPTALMMACGLNFGNNLSGIYSIDPAQNAALVKAMILHGAQVNAKIADGLTALACEVVFRLNPVIIKQLLNSGADPNIAFNGKTLIKLAEESRGPELAALLRKYSKHR